MVVDVGAVKRHVKPKADSTLLNMRKADLIKYIRCLENNYNVAVSFNENQARYIESLDAEEVVRCKECKFFSKNGDTSSKGCAWGTCRKHSTPCVYENEFCSRGERRE